MANVILTPSIIAKEMALQISTMLKFGNTITRGHEAEWGKTHNGYRPGQTVDIRIPVQYTVGTSATVSAQDHIQLRKQLSLSYRRNVAVSFTSEQLTYELGQFSEEVIQPAAAELAANMDYTAFDYCAKKVSNTYGTAGTPPDALADVSNPRRFLVEGGAPLDRNMYYAMCPAHVASLQPALGTLYNSTVTTKLLQESTFGRFNGFEFYESQNAPAHAFGSKSGGTAVVNGSTTDAGQVSATGTTIPQGTFVCDAATNTIANAGDTFTVASVYSVNPRTKQSTGNLKHFTVATAATASGTNLTMIVTEGVVASGPYQNVSATASNDAAITFAAGTGNATVNQSVAYHKGAFALASVPLYLPEGAAWAERATANGITVRLVKYYSGDTDVETCRADVLFGVTELRKDWACRIIG